MWRQKQIPSGSANGRMQKRDREYRGAVVRERRWALLCNELVCVKDCRDVAIEDRMPRMKIGGVL